MKASRAKGVDPNHKKPSIFDSAHRRWFVIVVRDTIKKVVGDAFWFLVLLALAGGAWSIYRDSHPATLSGTPSETSSQFSGLEAKFSELISALEQYHTDNGVYPKKLRDAYDVQSKSIAGLIYRGMGQELAGFKNYVLAAESKGKAYTYSSESKSWQLESAS